MKDNNEQNAPILTNLINYDFLNFGVEDMAYIRPVDVEGQKSYAIHAADGTPLSVLGSQEEAIATIRQNDLDAVVTH